MSDSKSTAKEIINYHKQNANRKMIEYLIEKMYEDEIESEYDMNFITNMQVKICKGFILTPPQEEYLYQLYHHKY